MQHLHVLFGRNIDWPQSMHMDQHLSDVQDAIVGFNEYVPGLCTCSDGGLNEIVTALFNMSIAIGHLTRWFVETAQNVCNRQSSFVQRGGMPGDVRWFSIHATYLILCCPHSTTFWTFNRVSVSTMSGLHRQGCRNTNTNRRPRHLPDGANCHQDGLHIAAQLSARQTGDGLLGFVEVLHGWVPLRLLNVCNECHQRNERRNTATTDKCFFQ